MASKLQQAEELCVEPFGWTEYQEYMDRYKRGYRDGGSPPLSQDVVDEYIGRLDKASKILTNICMLDSMTIDDRYRALIVFIRLIPDEGIDMLNRFRDLLPHLHDRLHDDMVKILARVTRCSNISSHERLATAVCLYNSFEFDICYGCFADLACDKSMTIKYRVEATRYLFGSGDEDNLQIAQEALLEIISTDTFPVDFRYKTIAGFISHTGIATMFNSEKIKVMYDEEFVYSLQTVFFHNAENDIRYRILSGQHMLQMECVTDQEKQEIGEFLLEVANEESHEENLRADAADTVLRCGTPAQIALARELIERLGFSPGDKSTFLERMRTVYTSSQNVHDTEIDDLVGEFIEKLVTEKKSKKYTYNEAHGEVVELIRSMKLDLPTKNKVFKALDRISIDTATFTKARTTISEIFVNVWGRIQTLFKAEEKQVLEQRLVNELVDMANTCSSGHAARLVNVFAVFDESLNISWGTQIKANIAGRMNARMRDVESDDLRASISLGMLEDADEEDAKAYRQFISDNLLPIRQQLEKEFVDDGYVKKAEFDTLFDDSAKSLFPESSL